MNGRSLSWVLSQTALVTASIVLAVFIFPTAASAATVIDTTSFPNTGSVTWTEAGSPYVVSVPVSKRFGSFTIEPGVVVKFMPGVTLSTHADVVTTVVGLSDKPIYFTSYKDDSVGGDTNGDGAASMPMPGDWGSVSFGGGATNRNMQLEYVKVRYGGSLPINTILGTKYPMLIVSYPWFNGSPGVGYTLRNIEASHSAGVGLYVLVGRGNGLTLTQVSLFANGTHGLFRGYSTDANGNLQSGAVSASGNWWGDPSGPYHPSQNQAGQGNAIDATNVHPNLGGSISFSPWLPTNPLPDPEPEPTCCSSVLFLPGLKGSKLKYGNDTLWPPTAISTFSGDIEQLALDESGGSVNDVKVDGVLESFYGTPIYTGFTSYLDQLVSDNLIKDWEPLPYDWRLSPERIITDGVKTNAGVINLADEVERLASESYSKKVAIVSHSYGGLVGKALIQELINRGEQNLVESFVLVGSPQLGTPQAVASILHGAGEGILGGIIVNPASSRAVAQNMESAYYLLPSRTYFDLVDDKPIYFDGNSSFTQEWRDYWGPGITNFVDFFGFLTGAGVTRTQPELRQLRIPEILDPDLLSNADSYHNQFDSFVYPANIRVVELVGWGLPTTESVVYQNEHFSQSYRTKQTIEGDGTVVYESGISPNHQSLFFNLFEYNKLPGNSYTHRDLLSAIPIKLPIHSVLIGESILETSYLSESKPAPQTVDDMLVLSSYSPVVIGAFDQFGRYTGVDLTQDLANDYLSIKQEIPGSSFLSAGESSSIYLPVTGTYEFVVRGVGDGPATLEVTTFAEATTTLAAVFADIPVTQDFRGSISVSPQTPREVQLEADSNGDGEIDQVLDSDLKKRPLTVQANNKTMVLGASLPDFDAQLVGFIDADTAADSVTGTAICTTIAMPTSPVGEYPIVCSLGTLESPKYEFLEFLEGTLTISYGFSGFLKPINDPDVNPSVFKAGSVVPVKFQLVDASGASLQSATSPEWLPPVKGDPLTVKRNEKKRHKRAMSGDVFIWKPKNEQYQYNWDTRGYEPGYWYEVSVKLDDGTIKSVMIGLR